MIPFSHALNHWRFSRSASTYAKTVARIAKEKARGGNVLVTLTGGGIIPCAIKKNVTQARILFKSGIADSLRESDFKNIIEYMAGSDARQAADCKTYRVRFESEAFVVEPPAGDKMGEQSRTRAEARDSLRLYYETETEALVEKHRQRIPAVAVKSGDSISSLRKRLLKECFGRAVRIAQDEIEKQCGLSGNCFAVIICAGAAREVSLFSDLDYIFVAGDEGLENEVEASYFEILVKRIGEVLRYAGVKDDNLVERFSQGEVSLITAGDLAACLSKRKWRDSLNHALVDSEQLEQVGSDEIYKQAKREIEYWVYAKNALKLRRWWRIYLRQSMRKNSVRRGSLPSPSVWLREVALFYMLAKHCLRLGGPGATESFDPQHSLSACLPIKSDSCFSAVLQSLKSQNVITQDEMVGFFAAHEFFMKLRNEAGLVRRGIERTIEQTEVTEIARNLYYPSVSAFLSDHKDHVQRIECMLTRMRQKAGQKRLILSVINIWGAALIKINSLTHRLLKGDGKVLAAVID